MRAIHLNDGWYLEFDGELYGRFATAEEALAFDDREMTKGPLWPSTNIT